MNTATVSLTWIDGQPNISANQLPDQTASIQGAYHIGVRFDGIAKRWYAYSSDGRITANKSYRTREDAKAAAVLAI